MSTDHPARAKPTVGVFIGRFQPFHDGHLHVVCSALERVDRLLILVGSADKPRGFFNPWAAPERISMIRRALQGVTGSHRVDLLPLPDRDYDDPGWIAQVRTIVDRGFPGAHHDVFLVGHRKDGTSYYQSRFPGWGQIEVENYGGISSTDIRRRYFTTTVPVENVPPAIREALDGFRQFSPQEFAAIEAEHQHVAMAAQPYAGLPYPPIFVTVDAVVNCTGHILLVQRNELPGRGLWALPGGFLESTERIEDAVYRELSDETGIMVAERTLRACTKRWRVYDAPHRSSRGRVITHAAYIDLGNGPLPEMMAAPPELGEVRDRRWWPIEKVVQSMMFEDHIAIISTILMG